MTEICWSWKKQMQDLRALVLTEGAVSNRTLRQADALVVKIMKEMGESAIPQLSEMLCGPECQPLPVNFLQHTYNTAKRFSSVTIDENLKDIVNKNVWSTNTPRIESCLNFWGIYGNDMTFEGRESQFVDLLQSHLSDLSLSSLLNLPKLIDGFIDHCKSKTSLNQDILSSVADVFLSILTKDVPADVSRSSARIFVANIGSFDRAKAALGKFSHDPARKCLIQAEIALQSSDAQYADQVLKDIVLTLESPSSSRSLTEGYYALGAILKLVDDPLPVARHVIFYMMRDFTSTIDTVRSSLTWVFNSLMKKAKNANSQGSVARLFIERIAPLPWQSKLKKTLIPVLLPYSGSTAGTELFETLVDVSQDPANSNFVSKCVSGFAESEQAKELVTFCLDHVKKAKITQKLPELQTLLRPIFEVNKLLETTLITKAAEDVNGEFINDWILMELVCSAGRVLKIPNLDQVIRDCMKREINSGNWDMRIGVLNTYVSAGFPKTIEDTDFLIESIPKLMFIDSMICLTRISQGFRDLIRKVSSQTKKFELINPCHFLSRIVDKFSQYLNASNVTIHRQTAAEVIYACTCFPQSINSKHLPLIDSLMTESAGRLRTLATLIKDIVQPSTHTDTKEKKSLHEADIPDTTDLETLKNFRNSLERPDVTLSIDEEIADHRIQTLINMLSQSNTDWETRAEISLIVALMCKQTIRSTEHEPTVTRAANQIFNNIVNSRNIGMVHISSLALEILLAHQALLSTEPLSIELANCLVEILDGYDMANMRRSAGLPYLAVTIIHSEPTSGKFDYFSQITSKLIEIVMSTDSETEAANALNILKAIICDKESSTKVEIVLSSLVKALLYASNRFKSWDVVAAINIAIVAIIGKFGKVSSDVKLLQIVREQFFKRVHGIREIMLDTINNGSPHGLYLCLLILQLFVSDSGDDELFSAIIKHRDSRVSRIRRIVARSAIAVLDVTKRDQIFKQFAESLSLNNANKLHGDVLILKELVKVGVQPVPCNIPVEKIPPPILSDFTYVFKNANVPIRQGLFTFNTMKALGQNCTMAVFNTRSLNYVIRYWGNNNTDVSKVIFDSIINENYTNLNKGLVTTAFTYLLQNNISIPSNKGDVLLDLINKTSSLNEKAMLVSLLSHVVDFDSTRLLAYTDTFIDFCLRFSSKYTPMHMAIASHTNKLCWNEHFLPVMFLLCINDVPQVRHKVMCAASPNFISEACLVRQIIEKMTPHQKLSLSEKWLNRIQKAVTNDPFGEPLTYIVSEFYIWNVMNDKEVDMDYSKPLKDLRAPFIEHARLFHLKQ